jgi:hypothetical protein
MGTHGHTIRATIPVLIPGILLPGARSTRLLLPSRSIHYDGIGFVFSEDSPYFGISLDNAYNPETQTVEPWAQPFVQRINSYTEILVSITVLDP